MFNREDVQETREMINPAHINRVLLFAHMGIGNLIMFMPAMRTFRNYFSGASFSLVTSRQRIGNFKDLVRDLIDEYIPFNGSHAGIIERERFVSSIKEKNFDLLIKNFLGDYNNLLGKLDVPHRVGHISSGGFKIRRDGVFNHPAVMKKDEHEIDRNMELCYAIGIEDICKDFRISLGVNERRWAHDFLAAYDINNPMVCMQIGTSKGSDWKEWSGFGDLAELVGKETRIALLGDKNAVPKADCIKKSTPSVINLVGETTLMQAAAILERAKLLVSNDGGLIWLAQALSTPVVVIYGPTDHTRTGPVGPKDKIIRKELPCSPCYRTPKDYYKPRRCRLRRCLSTITPDEVAEEVIKTMSNLK
ncbi:hypothetical protein CH333_01895 [candidate division WOR-3 bacterium JGI_Cruoil_03_44_89]|uniref:Lipopolysaccharide heptosyltransferase II n=1 Tax=candidate division WOR-3 bacterium JGI_Cruoil_03_44_89 TaxID=1973748 RepID=A0A235BY13_UNCW3|nr:MAG: hypothetical protein CH333_01895 [candidate division WOR-3 bacterium JGI_Cruoil_03_44_89]